MTCHVLQPKSVNKQYTGATCLSVSISLHENPILFYLTKLFDQDESDDSSLLKIWSPEIKIVLNVNPPDIIASEIHRPPNPTSTGVGDEAELGQGLTEVVECDGDLMDEPIVLPDHLQKLVDDAMKDILCQSFEQ